MGWFKSIVFAIALLTASVISVEAKIIRVEKGTEVKTERQLLIETFSKLSNSVGALYALEADGDMAYLCTATAVGRYNGKTIIITAYHCIRKGVSYLINFGDNKFYSVGVWKIPHYEIDANKYPRAYNEPKTDMALFLLDEIDIPIVPLAGNGRLIPGSKLAMVGFPLGIAKISYEGTVAGYLNRLGSDDYNYMLLQIFGAPGSSGSAIVSVVTGQIVGILVSGKSNRFSGLPVIFAVPIDYLKNLRIVPGADGEKTENKK